ncbi:methylammonium permease 3 [Cadophora sp. DSE1049]|nr:methylammonium permease 3 [Cadophora sp. DSE1049]
MDEVVGPVFNESMPGGGDALTTDVQAQYIGYEIHYLFIIIAAFLVWMIIPGVGLLYGGLTRRKSSLALIFQTLMLLGVTTFQWMFWGYSLAYSRTGGPFIGNMDHIGLRNVWLAPQGDIPDIAFCLYQLLFCTVTVQILIGGSFERGRILPSLLFAFFWATIVYCPVAYWTWNGNGWLYNLPDLDYAGGGPVHIASGVNNTTMVFLGTVLIWFGWFGFNGGSTLSLTVRSIVAAFNTQIAAGFGVIGWSLVVFIRTRGKFSVVGACEGAIAGLVGITPAAGYVSPWLAGVIGLLTAIVCASLENLNKWIRIDEGLDVFKLHGVGGMVGCFLTGIFATNTVSMVDGTEAPGGIDGNGLQIGYQLASICAITAYSFTVSRLFLLVMKYIPGLHLRVSEEVEINGLDGDHFFEEQIGEWAEFERLNAKNHILEVAPISTNLILE